MTLRAVHWAPTALQAARTLPAGPRREVRDLIAALATGPIPPEAGHAIADPDLPGIWHLRTAHTAVIAGIYDNEVRIWIVRPHT